MTSFGCLGAGDQHGTDDEVGVDHGLLDLVGVGGDRLQAALVLGVQFAQAVDVDVQDGDVGTQAQGHGGGVGSGNAGAQDNHLGRADAGDAAEQHALAAGRGHQRGGAHLDGQAAGNLGHRGQQRQGPAFLDGLVGDGGDAGVDQFLGQLRLGGQVQVREEDQALAEAVVFGLDRFLDLHDHVGAAPDVVGFGDDLGAGDRVFLVRDAGAQARAALDEDHVAVGAEFVDASSGDGDAEFVVLDLFGYTDDHLLAPVVRASWAWMSGGFRTSRINPAVRHATGAAAGPAGAGRVIPGFFKSGNRHLSRRRASGVGSCPSRMHSQCGGPGQ